MGLQGGTPDKAGTCIAAKLIKKYDPDTAAVLIDPSLWLLPPERMVLFTERSRPFCNLGEGFPEFVARQADAKLLDLMEQKDIRHVDGEAAHAGGVNLYKREDEARMTFAGLPNNELLDRGLFPCPCFAQLSQFRTLSTRERERFWRARGR